MAEYLFWVFLAVPILYVVGSAIVVARRPKAPIGVEQGGDER